MPLTQEELGARLRTARESCRMTQEAVAEQLGVSRPTIVQIESGRRAVTSLELQRLSWLFGRDIRDLLAPSFEGENPLAALLRAEPSVADDGGVADGVRECMELARELTNLERLVGIHREQRAVVSYDLVPPATRWDAIQQGRQVADEERRRLDLGASPLPELTELLEAESVRTAVIDLPDDISGLTLRDRRVGLFVAVNRSHAWARRRFSFAHEYAHVLTDRDRLGLVSRSSERDNLIEVRANAFAANFLMPENGVVQFISSLGKGSPARGQADVFDEDDFLSVEGRSAPGSQDIQLYDVVRLAHHFGVSRIAALYRLQNLRLVNRTEFESLKALDDAGRGKDLARLLDLPDPNDSDMRNEFRRRFLALALEAYRRGEISRRKLDELAELVSLSDEDVDALIEPEGTLFV